MKRRRRLLLLESAAIATPLVALALVLTDTSPSVATASELSAGAVAPPAMAPPKSPSPEQTRALAWLRGLEQPPAMRSPLDHPSTRPKPIVREPSRVAPAAADPLEGITLSAVIEAGESGMASIDGVLFKIGDEIRPGITLVSVEPRQSAVVVRLPDGTQRRLQRPDRSRTPSHRH